ncbi:MAG: hypothetical protein V4631_22265 [Pseudomonadota bacterium]
MPNDQRPYSRTVSSYDGPTDLLGRTVHAFHSEYSFAALRLDNDQVIAFAVEEVSVGKWFEVFPICRYKLPSEFRPIWTELEAPFTAAGIAVMWREEWLEPAMENAGLLGSGPHYAQFASVLGSAPTSSTSVVKVLAGLRLTDQGDRSLVVCSSDNTPFKADFTTDSVEIQQVMQFHTCE